MYTEQMSTFISKYYIKWKIADRLHEKYLINIKWIVYQNIYWNFRTIHLLTVYLHVGRINCKTHVYYKQKVINVKCKHLLSILHNLIWSKVT